MPTKLEEIPLPSHYADLPYSDIRLTHVPLSSKAVTKTILITLYRPTKHNAFTETMMRELESAFQLLDLDDRVKCIVVTGHGKMFCAGADLEAGFLAKSEDGEEREKHRTHRDGGGRVVLAIHRCRKPVIGAVNGSAVGVGVTMTLPMTIRVAYEKAKIGMVFSRRGLVMEAASSFFLPRLIGMSRALHLVTTGAVYPASHRLLNDLYSELLPQPEQVLPRALEIADEIVTNTSTISTYLCRELMYRDTGSAEAQHLLDSQLLWEIFRGKDNKEGVASFLEKRSVQFTGTMVNDAPAAYPWWDPIETRNRPVAKGWRYGHSKL